MKSFQGKVKYWVTFNETNHMDPQSENLDLFTYMITAIKYSQLSHPQQMLATMSYHMILASVKAVALAHKIDVNNQVGCVFGLTPVYPSINVMNAFKEMEKDYYQIDAMVHGNFLSYKIAEYQKARIDLNITDDDWEETLFGNVQNPYLQTR